ncbi:MAG TPA: hypothetical protein DDW52_10240 [Planctomycetaceae bacterium]|nr:hypothetical protein [Planctomycetaceae bacterium]
MANVLQMLHGHRESAWNHTAALICNIRLAAGDRNAKPEKYHPLAQVDPNNQFKQFVKRQRNE